MSQSLRIVVADDDSEMLRYYIRMIPHLHHIVLGQATNGLEVVELCLGLHPDLAVSDISMPKLDGISAMERVQAEINIPFIFVSADDETDHRNRLKRGNVLKYLQKPVTHTQLLPALEVASAAVFA